MVAGTSAVDDELEASPAAANSLFCFFIFCFLVRTMFSLLGVLGG